MQSIMYIGPAIIIGTILFGIIGIINAFSHHFLRKKILDKNNMDERVIQAMRLEDNRQTALKWGMVVFFGGIGLVLLSFIPYDYNSPLPYGVEAVMISLGFLVYYFIEKRQQSAD